MLDSQRLLSDETYIPHSIHTSDAIVHLQYEYGQEPPKPSTSSHNGSSVPQRSEDSDWTRFVCLSDTHCNECPVPDGDVLLHSGDLTQTGTLDSVKEVVEWLSSLPHKVKIIIAGNHDLPFHHGWYEKTWKRWHDYKEDQVAIMELVKGPAAKEAGIIYLDCEEHQFGVKEGGNVWSVYGSPWQPEFGSWAFNYRKSQAHVIVDKIPKVDILLTHGPPYDILDLTSRGKKVGCQTLASRLPLLQPRLHVFGHIHESRGAYVHTWDKDSPSCPTTQSASETFETPGAPEGNRTVFVNASNTPKSAHWNPAASKIPFGGPGFQPVIIDLRDNTG